MLTALLTARATPPLAPEPEPMAVELVAPPPPVVTPPPP
ncbi:MAG: hypothetical protein JWQ52_1138, partial [Phenylobacterium sp.]|nr:hypothetical protein [Phenylobacterium sp.]